VHAAAFVDALKVPTAQSTQVRFVVEEPEKLTWLPAAHKVLGTQTVAGFWSSSHRSPEQSTGGVVPPAQN
jgi:hypothetical protein